MNAQEIYQKRIEEAAKKICCTDCPMEIIRDCKGCVAMENAIETGIFALQNQWISVEEVLPEEDIILALLSKRFCGRDNCYEILHRIAKKHIDLRHPDGYYDPCGENVPTLAITYWVPIPQLKGGEK